MAKKSLTKAKVSKKVAVSKVFQFTRKRDGRIVPFDQTRITEALLKALHASGEGNGRDAKKISDRVVKVLLKKFSPTYVLSIEEIQDSAENALILLDYAKTAKAYILYRKERERLREARKEVPAAVKQLVAASKKYFKNPLAEFVYYRTYSRWIDEDGRRETWIETAGRYMAFMKENLGDKLSEKEYGEVHEAILNQQAMPSMRLLQFAGKAARKTNVCAYNCSFIAPTRFEDFAEIVYISMCGTGVGFSVEHQNVEKLPQIERQTGEKLPDYVIEDSKEGWADSLLFGMKTWFAGKDVVFDYSGLRAAGVRLKTMGGRSSGPAPLHELLDFTRRKILAKQGRRLGTIDVHDIICKIGEIVVSGGVRRSALISLSDLDDPEMRDAKNGQFYLTEPQRSLANNSAVYNEKPTASQFLDEWVSLAKSGTGERGIFNRGGLHTMLPKRRIKALKGYLGNLGTNPCGEIILQSRQFCNLSEVVARPEDTEATLLEKVRVATIVGTYQSTLTNFGYLSKEWRENCEAERLLGVSVTGQWDCEAARNPEVLRKMRDTAIRVNEEYAKRFGVGASTCITCVKPSGNLSQTVDASSGMHTRYAEYYIRRVRISATDSLFKMLKDQKLPYHPEVGQSADTANTYVLEFPVKAPEGAVTRKDITALVQLEHWKLVKTNYTEHNPSVTVYVAENEWIMVANWLYNNWEYIGGLSFLPKDNHVYALAPYEEITKERYEELLAKFPDVDFSQIFVYEHQDETENAKELACVAGVCEIS
ncbi:MAG: ATP cone domain-containing protein [bacterium]|nr:ATP cone domain-containing protein [bacterium]